MTTSNLIERLSDDLKKEIKRYGATEVFFFYDELYTTSNHEIPTELLEKVETELESFKL